MAQIIAAISLGVFLALSALVWNNWGPPTQVSAGADPRSLAITDVMQKVDAKGLPRQQIEDRAMVFSDQQDR